MATKATPKDNGPIPAGGMVRSKGELVPRYLKDMADNAPIREMVDTGKGLEVVPDKKYKKGGKVFKGYGKARKV